MNLEEMLNMMSRYGHPRLIQLDSGWRCSVDLSIAVPGVESRVKSEWVDNPMTATSQCYDRLLGMLSDVRKALDEGDKKLLEGK